MSIGFILLIAILYFFVLFFISYLTGKSDSSSSFFKGDNKSPWYVVAFGMIGTSLSGITFISVPGWVKASQMSYMQMAFGYFFGYLVIAFVLMPLYYRYNVISIYSYLEDRFGTWSYRISAFYFLLSRIIGAGLRLFLVALVLQYFIFEEYHIPFSVTVSISIFLIWVYTFRGGIRTIVWTDTLQTLFMLFAVVLSIYLILQKMNWSFFELFSSEEYSSYGQILFLKDWRARHFFVKQFIAGIFIAICMTGLDQDMMQKNLSCKNLKEAQINMISFAFILILVHFIFLILGVLLFIYADSFGISIPMIDGKEKTDLLYPEIALNGKFSIWLGLVFILGFIAATYSSVDSALAALTTSVCIDFLSIEKREERDRVFIRKIVHFIVSLILLVVVIILNRYLDRNVIDELFSIVSYTYGPLLGIFAFGIFTRKKIRDRFVPLVCLLSPLLSWGLSHFSKDILFGYQFGYELLIVNGVITFIGLSLLVKKTGPLQNVHQKTPTLEPLDRE